MTSTEFETKFEEIAKKNRDLFISRVKDNAKSISQDNMDSSKSPAPTSNSSEAMLISELVSYTEDFLHDLLQAFLPIDK